MGNGARQHASPEHTNGRHEKICAPQRSPSSTAVPIQLLNINNRKFTLCRARCRISHFFRRPDDGRSFLQCLQKLLRLSCAVLQVLVYFSQWFGLRSMGCHTKEQSGTLKAGVNSEHVRWAGKPKHCNASVCNEISTSFQEAAYP
jgi:hypothetical protein